MRADMLCAMTRRGFDFALQRLLQYTFEAQEHGGYAGSRVDEAQQRVDLYWKGDLPASLVGLLEDIRPACRVQVFPAAHDVLELRSARSRITSTSGCRSSGIVTLALAHDGSGLVLGYDTEEPPEQFVDRLGLGVPVRWERAFPPEPIGGTAAGHG